MHIKVIKVHSPLPTDSLCVSQPEKPYAGGSSMELQLKDVKAACCCEFPTLFNRTSSYMLVLCVSKRPWQVLELVLQEMSLEH